jgi:hypothetical protein
MRMLTLVRAFEKLRSAGATGAFSLRLRTGQVGRALPATGASISSFQRSMTFVDATQTMA